MANKGPAAPARNARDGSTIRFDARIRKIGNSTVVRLPQEASAKLPSRGQVAVTGLINGTPFRTVVEPDGRRGHRLKVDKTLQPAPGSGQGADVAVELEPTNDWPEPDIRRTFRALLPARPSYPSSGRTSRPCTLGMGALDQRDEEPRGTPATRRSGHLETPIGKRRPCCFNLAACTDPDLSKNGKLVEVA
jgi:Domain of unknown function (DUF1905)